MVYLCQKENPGTPSSLVPPPATSSPCTRASLPAPAPPRLVASSSPSSNYAQQVPQRPTADTDHHEMDLLHMYCKMGYLDSARKVFDKMPRKDVASWNAMVSSLSQSSNPCETLEILWRIQMESVELNFVSILNLPPIVS
ncbi:Pentatricopeptide repeat-containing protein [Spatholobus suberectus]|nr:Pentatricopeptide repeat-containing protein [Spatholobus suberectus]